MPEKIVITGWGGVSSAGQSIDETWNTIKQGQSCIDVISNWDSTGWDHRLGAEIKNFDPKPFMDRKLLKLISRHDTFGLAAVEQAIRHSDLVSYRNTLSDPTEFNERTGVYVSSSGSKFYQQYDFFPLFSEAQGDIKKFGTELSNIVHPMWLLRTLPNNVLAYAGIQYGFKGPNQNIVNHSVGGVQAITEAALELMRGTMDRAVVIGYDSVVEPQLQMYFSALGVLSKQGLKPFDKNRDGTILGEGAGALILETLSAAKKRGATIYAEVTPGTSTSEGAGIFSIREDGEGLMRVMGETLKRAQLSPKDIGMIAAHSNGAEISDRVEAESIRTLFGDAQPPVTGFKWAIGHTFSAAGVLETILTVLSLKEGIAPGIATLQQKANDCSALKVNSAHQPLQKSTALLINRGFGSVSSSLVINV